MDTIYYEWNDETREFRWTRVAPNGKTVGAATESYHNRADMVQNMQRLNGRVGYKVVDRTKVGTA